MARTTAHVTPAVLRWARESIGYDLAGAAKKIGTRPGKLAAAEAGQAHLTLRQAEKAADAYEQPLGVLFMPTPPQEEPQTAQYRQLADAPPPPWPPEMALIARRVRQRQEAAIELLDLLDEPARWPGTAGRLSTAKAEELPDSARKLLGITLEEQLSWRDAVGYAALRRWTDAVEHLGVLVTQTGEVNLDLMRGFASNSESVPAIVLNVADDPRARAYTAIHELGHLALQVRREAPNNAERWCEEFAGNVLMPPDSLAERFGATSGSLIDRVDTLARDFSVTPAAAAIRCIRYALIGQPDGEVLMNQIRGRRRSREGVGGGNYYSTQIGRIGPSFIRLVFSALENQALTYPSASTLLGVKVNNFDRLRGYLERREGVSL
jgi:Zn-dependent peptidase ImmA (M78 family)